MVASNAPEFSFMDYAALNQNCNSSQDAFKPGNVNPEFGANEPGCGCTFSYNGGAGGGTAAPCCDGKPYESGFNDKKRDCECASSQLYQEQLVNKNPEGVCSAEYKYTPEFNYPPQPCPPENTQCARGQVQESGGCPYQGGLVNKKTPECSAEFKYVVPSAEPKDKGCFKGESCCDAKHCCEPDTYEKIKNTDAQRYKGKGPDRSNFYADDDCGCSNNAVNVERRELGTDWAEIRKQSYASTDPQCSPLPEIPVRSPSFCVEKENYV